MSIETKAWLIEEFDANGKLVWKIISFFEPDAIQWEKDLKGKKHNLIISELGVIKTKTILGIEKKYDSTKFVVGL
jgi:hypothetical protein